MDEGTTERNQTLPLCVQWSYSRWGCWTAAAATITILKWLGFGGDFFFFNIFFLFPPWWRLFRRRLGEKGPVDNFLLNITKKFEGKSQDILTYAIDFWAMFPRQPIDAFCGIQLRSVGRARTKQSREAPPHTLCFPAVENLHDDQRSISCNALDWPTCFSMILPHFLNIYQIFINFIEQRRLFFWVLSRLLKNFARKSSTSCLVLWQK